MRKYIFSIFVFTVFALCACGLFEDKDLQPEAVAPVDSSFAMVIDYSNENQVEILKNIFAKFPKTDFGDQISGSFLFTLNDEEVKDELTEKYLKPVFSEKWKMVLAGKGDFLNNDFMIYIAGKFEEENLMEDFVNEFLKNKSTKNDKDGAEIWKDTASPMYVAKYDDIFWFSTDFEDFEETLSRVKNQDGFKEISKDNLAYLYADGEILDIALNTFYYSAESNVKSFIENFYTTVFADLKGLNLIMDFDLQDEGKEFFEEKWGKEKKMAEKIPGDGLGLYLEHNEFSEIFRFFMIGKNLRNGEGNFDYEKWKAQIFSDYAIPLNDLEEFFESPFVLALYDTEQILPGLGFYVSIPEGEVNAANGLIRPLDEYVDDFIEGFNGGVVVAGGGEALKKEILAVNGQALRKVSLDWDKMPVETVLSYNVLLGTRADLIKVELYYGMIDADTFVLAFYPDFPEFYGSDVLAENEKYMKFLGEYREATKYGIFYVDTEAFINVLERYVEMTAKQKESEKQESAADGAADGAADSSADGAKNLNETIEFLRKISGFISLITGDEREIFVTNFLGIE